ncbi:hypothetical protein [Methylobacterium nigriterrae]|uniref:hypothetical protein n=1 Tax=Methylobacterium nigriterrae TaxID=3127512 RepID=UPI003013880B
MRILTIALLATTLGAGAALAQPLQRFDGYLGTPVVSYDARLIGAPAYAPNREAVFESSAKGGNAEQTQRSVPNLGNTTGGPALF